MADDDRDPLRPDPFVVAGTELGSRLLLGTGGMTSPESLAAALVASGTALATVAVRRVDPTTRHSLVDLLGGARHPDPAQHRRLLHRRGRRPHRQAGPRGVRDRLGQARGHRRRPDPAARRRRAGRRGRAAGRRRLRRPPLLRRRPGGGPAPRAGRLRRRDAPRRPDRQWPRDPQPPQHRPDRRAGRGAGGPRRRHRHRLGRLPGHGARMQRRAGGLGRDPGRGPGPMAARHAGRGRRGPGRPPGRTDHPAFPRRGLDALRRAWSTGDRGPAA